jgi:uncharacterized membrane protein
MTARERLKGNWTIAIIISVIVAVLSGIGTAIQEGVTISYYITEVYPVILEGRLMEAMEMTSYYAPPFWTDGIVMLNTLLIVPLTTGVAFVFLNMMRGIKPQVKDSFSKYSIFGKCILTDIYTSVIIVLWALLFIVPGIIAAYGYALVPYIICDDENLSVTETAILSKEMMNGHKMELFVLHLSFIGWSLLSLFTFGILEIVYVTPYRNAAIAEFYQRVKAEYEGCNNKNNQILNNDGDVIG